MPLSYLDFEIKIGEQSRRVGRFLMIFMMTMILIIFP